MVQKDIENLLIASTPFDATEITEKVMLDRIISKALKDMNKYRPLIKKTYDDLTTSPDYTNRTVKFIRTYSSKYSDYALEDAALWREDSSVIGYNVFAINWIIDDIDKESIDGDYFERLLIAIAGMYLSNPRRGSEFSEIPVDLKGDQFYQEYKAEYDELIIELNDQANNSL